MTSPPQDINEPRNVARRLSIYQRLIAQFDSSANLLMQGSYRGSLQAKFLSDIQYLMNISDVNEKVNMLDYFADELERQADELERQAAQS